MALYGSIVEAERVIAEEPGYFCSQPFGLTVYAKSPKPFTFSQMTEIN